MIPLSADAGLRRRLPVINYTLIAANILVYIAEVKYGPCFQAEYSVVPAAITAGTPATFTGCSVAQPIPVYITLVTAMFLHANLLHIAGNMLFLWIFGDNVEDRLGHIGYLLFYLVCGVVANGAQIAISPHSTLLNLGASGAIAGVLGAYIVFFPGAQVRTLVYIGFFFTIVRLSAFIVIGLWFVLQLVSSYESLNPAYTSSGGVAYFAHVGGFVTGLVIGLILRPFTKPPRSYMPSYPYWPQHPNLRNG